MAGEHNYHFDIKMTCSGCSGAIERVLKKTKGIKSYTVSLESQSADVVVVDNDDGAEPPPGFDDVLEKIRKTGKSVLGASRDGEAVAV